MHPMVNEYVAPLAGAWELGLVLSPRGGVDVETYKALMRHHAAGVALITADPGDGPVALTVTSLISISADPPLVAFSLSELSSATPAVRRASTLVIHLLADTELDLAQLGATSGIDRFGDTSAWGRLETGEPYFLRPSLRLRARTVTSVTAGSSLLVVAQIVDAWPEAPEGRRPLVYVDRTWYSLNDGARIG